MNICDNDCFNCKYPDCIRTFSGYDMYREAHKRYESSEKGKANEHRKMERRIKSGKNAETCKRYYYRHREEILRKKENKKNGGGAIDSGAREKAV